MRSNAGGLRSAAAAAGAAALGGVMLIMAMSVAAAAQFSAEGSVLLGRAEHRVDAGYGIAASTGTTLGLWGRARGWKLVELDVAAAGGRLQGDSVAGTDRRMGEIGLRLNMLALPWLAVGTVAAARGYETAAATQRWSMLGGGAELRLDFAGGDVRSVIGATLLPRIRVSGQPAPDLGVITTAGLRLARGRILVGMDYTMERYVFAGDPLTGTRREQLSGLVVRLGSRW